VEEVVMVKAAVAEAVKAMADLQYIVFFLSVKFYKVFGQGLLSYNIFSSPA
jgi:hypothetical protein